MSEEVWRILDTAPSYEVSNTGKLRSTKTRVVYKSYLRATGYISYSVVISSGERKTMSGHRLVAMAFLERTEGKNVVNHIDSNRSNNNVCNLEWCDQQHNSIHGVANQRSKTPNYSNSKITSEVVAQIVERFKNSGTKKGMAREFGICESNIRSILTGKTWMHVTGLAPNEKLKRNIKRKIDTSVRLRNGSWEARISVNNKMYHIGSFKSKDAAIEAREIMHIEWFGQAKQTVMEMKG